MIRSQSRARSMFRVVATTSLAALLAGCAVGPDFERPKAPEVSRLTPDPLPAETVSIDVQGGETQRFVQALDIPGQWWTLFQSKPLNQLIEQALKANPEVTAAEAALRAAHEAVAAEEGAFFPTLTGGFTSTRQKDATGSLASAAISGAPLFNVHTASLAVSYAPDVFGGTRRQVESLEAQAENQRFQLEATYLTLSSNLVTAAVQEASLRGQIDANEEIVRIETELLDLLQKQYAHGQIALADVVAQEAALAQAQASLPGLLKQLAQTRDQLAALTGRFPSEQPSDRFDLASLQLPQELPVSLPSKLVEQRPDVRAAEAQMHSASAQVGVAIANMLPQFTLTAGAGKSANKIGDLFMPGNGFWNLAAGFTQPIFDGGTLLHKRRGADAAYDQAAAQYRSTVINAFQNVADALQALQHDAEAVKRQTIAERAAAKSLDIARKRVQLGDISYLSLLNAQQTYQQARIALVQAQAARYADTAALFQALGGGWWNRSDVPSSTQ